MFLTRKIGKLLRGNVSAPQVYLACLLGGMLGFVPGFFLAGDLGGGFRQSPALILGLFSLALVLNANFALFGLVTALAKLLSILALPVSFAVGRWMLEGPMQQTMAGLVESPVLAWCGLEYYATSGGVVVGAVLGLVTGHVFWKLVSTFRKTMATLDTASPAFAAFAGKGWVRFVSWIFLGGKAKESYADLLQKRSLNPIRVSGVVFVGLLVGAGWFAHGWLVSPALQKSTVDAMEYWNRATVDMDSAVLDLGTGEVSLKGLAVADRGELDKDRFRAANLELRVDTGALLRKQFVVETLTISEASTGRPRTTKAVEFPRPAEEPPVEPPAEGAKSLEDYLATAAEWKQKLQEVADLLEQLGVGSQPAPAEAPEQRTERIEKEIADVGLARVVATHLVRAVPAVLVKEVRCDGIDAAELPGDPIALVATNLSSHPSLVDAPATLSLSSKSGRFRSDFRLGGKDGVVGTKFVLGGIPTDTVTAQLKSSPIQGGTVDVALDGNLVLAGGTPRIAMPLQVTLHDTTLTIPGIPPLPVQNLPLPIDLSGPITSPGIRIDDAKLGSSLDQLANSLIQSGRKELAGQVRSRSGELLKGKVPSQVTDAAAGIIDGTKTPEQVAEEAKKLAEQKAQEELNKQLEAAKQKAAEEKKKAEEAARKKLEDELKKKLPGGLPFGGTKKQ
ncbi:MAG: hypothetical protein RL148_2429 [Planctomycetota bacterium]